MKMRMAKMIFALLVLRYSICAQNTKEDSIRIFITQNEDVLLRTEWFPQVFYTDLLHKGKTLTEFPSDTLGVYSIESSLVHNTKHLLLLKGDEFILVNMNKELSDVLQELCAYLKEIPNLSKNEVIDCVEKVSQIYYFNIHNPGIVRCTRTSPKD